MGQRTTSRSTAEDQRRRILGVAVRTFSRAGYFATPVADIATEAEVSPAYVFRLFGGKLELFVFAVESCYDQVAAAMSAGGETSRASNPVEKVDAMANAYVDLIADRTLIALQGHAQSACEIPEVRDAVRRGLAKIAQVVSSVPGVTPDDVQRLVAYGQLCNLIVQAGLDELDTEWAKALTNGIRHS
jgi:AcrR family transcriptional regulator